MAAKPQLTKWKFGGRRRAICCAAAAVFLAADTGCWEVIEHDPPAAANSANGGDDDVSPDGADPGEEDIFAGATRPPQTTMSRRLKRS
jgi:hypothetical protein